MHKTVLPFLLGSYLFFFFAMSQPTSKKKFWPHKDCMRYLSFSTRDWTCAPVGDARSLNHWAARELPQPTFWVVYPDPSSPTSLVVGIVRLCNSGDFPESRYPVLLQQHRRHRNQLLPTAPCWVRNWTEPHRTQSTGQAVHKLPKSWGCWETFLAGCLAPAPHPHPH